MSIDEGQDIAINEFMLLYNLNQKNVIFNIYGDTNQLIKSGRGISKWSELNNIFHATNYKLNENYCNANQITRFCNRSFNMDVLRTGVDGSVVREINRSELEAAISELKINTERIAVLLPRSVQKNRYIHRDELPVYISDRIGDDIDNGRIAVKYVDEVKGIEFDRVYVVSNKMSRNEKYIAYTRALSDLIIVFDEDIKDYDDGSKAKVTVKNTRREPKKSSVENKGSLIW